MQYSDIYRGDIYWADLSGYIGSEQNGPRPVLIVQNEMGNAHSPTTMIAPLTSKQKPTLPTHLLLTPDDCGILYDSTVLCEQMRVIDKTRLRRKLGKILNPDKLEEINEKLMISIGLQN